MKAKPWQLDTVIAAALAVIAVPGTMATGAQSDMDRPIDALAIALVLAAVLVVTVRRRRPLVTLGVAALAVSVYLLLGYPYGPIFFPFVVAVYTVARILPLATAVPAALTALAVLVPHLFTHESAIPGLLGLVPATAWVVVPFAIGVTVRLTHEARLREQAEAVRQHVYDERLRVAQEVHDVVGHGLAAIKMQADVALHVLGSKPEQAETALSAISRGSEEALGELRATLALVRGSPGSPRDPAPNLDRLGDVRDRMAQAGVDVDLEVTGTRIELPAAAGMAGYRVVQESLTNVLRHGESKRATVRVSYDAGVVVLVISNPVRHPPTGGEGLGIPGMRERVTALGGEFTAGPTSDGRFEVRAVIPAGGAR